MTEVCLHLSQRLAVLTLSWWSSLSFICTGNQWTGFYMIETSVMKELKLPLFMLAEGPFKKLVTRKNVFRRRWLMKQEWKVKRREERMLSKKWCHSPKIFLHLKFCSWIFPCLSLTSFWWMGSFFGSTVSLCVIFYLCLFDFLRKAFLSMVSQLISIEAVLKMQASVTNQGLLKDLSAPQRLSFIKL